MEATQTSKPRRSRPRLLGGAALAGVLFGGTALVILSDWLGLGGSELHRFARGALYDAVVLAAALACLARAWTTPHERMGWGLMGLAILCWGAGEVYWTLYIGPSPAPPYPSPADALYLAFYPLACVALAALVGARAKELDWRRWTDAAIAALGTAALGTAFVFDFVADHTSGGGVQLATTLAYPLADIVIFAAIVGVIALSGWRPGRAWSLLLAGLAAQAVADVAYTLQSTDGVVPAGSWIDPIYLISAVFLGSVLWLPKTTAIEPSAGDEGWRELMVPAVFTAVMIGLFALRFFSGGSGLSNFLRGMTMVAVVVRLALSVRENRSLLEQVRTDQLTGLGNRGRMQVDLDEKLARATTSHPLAVYLFDLNGFKRYNDSFGHPAGDALLARLGQALQDAVGEDGAAYRIGGDEFCVLLDCEADRFGPVVLEAARALTASEKGVDVSSSWGGARVPEEAGDPSEAMQLADVRMYAQKESRRVAASQPRLDGAVKVSAWPSSKQSA